jgi:hypothetical protein
LAPNPCSIVASTMAKKPNYNFEKQQREQAKERKKAAKAEEKRLRRLADRDNPSQEQDGGDQDSDTP